MNAHHSTCLGGCPTYAPQMPACDFRWQTPPQATVHGRYYHPGPLYPGRDPLARRIPTLHFAV